MRPIRLAYLMGRLEPGGAELQMLALARHLTRDGFRVDVVLRAGTGSLLADVRGSGAAVRITGELTTAATPAPIAIARRVTRPLRWVALARHRYDIVDAWLYPADVEATLTRPLTRTPVVMSARLGRAERRQFGPASRPLDRLMNRTVDMVVANSAITAADAIEGGVPPERVRIIRGGVRMPQPVDSAGRRSFRKALGVADGDLLVGNVANFRPMKRQDLLIDAVARLLPEFPSLRLVLVGDGDLRPDIEGQICRLGLERHVLLTGSLLDVQPLYAALDLYVHASNSEGLPNVLLEAAAASLPIVATAAGGSGEIIRDGETGLLVPVDDVDALVSAIRLAISEAALRSRLGQAARELAQHEYGMDRFCSEYSALYREMLAGLRNTP